MAVAATKINYSELVSAYYSNLNDNLRHFRGGPGFLETWVHDEDHGRSLLSILDLAHSAGLEILEVELPEDIDLPWDWLQKEAFGLGQLELDGSCLRFRPGKKVGLEENVPSIHPAYRSALSERKIRYSGRPSHFVPQRWLIAETDGLLLGLEHEEGIVVSGFHEAQGFYSPLLDCFVEVLVGRSLSEGAEHGLIRLEKKLRSPSETPPVPGLVTPENADPSFLLLQKLIRTIAAPEKASAWRDPLPQTWVNLSDEEKMAAALSAIHSSLGNLSLPDPGLELLGVKNNTRFVISYPPSPAHKYWHFHMIELERALRRELGFEAELQLADLGDRNKRVERTQRITT